MNDIVPANISRIIDNSGLKQTAVAKRAGYTDQQLSDMLNGRKIIRVCDVIAISSALGVDVSELYAVSKDQPSPAEGRA